VPEAPRQSDPLTVEVGNFIDARRLIAADAGVVVGVSGGADSVALLAVLRDLAGEAGRHWRLTVAHLNHHLRAGADEDARFVAELAARWRLPCVVEKRDAAAEARRTGRGLEEAGRRLRYEFLSDVAAKARAGRVAVGHHADDSVETVLYHICRGTHLRGLAGIPAARPLGEAGVMVVRPLLGCRREQLEAFCRRSHLTWRTDPTNAELDFRRNFIRHRLLPLLREHLNARTDEAISRLAAAAEKIEAYLATRAAEVLKDAQRPAERGLALDADVLAREDAVVRGYVMRLALAELGVPSGQLATERLEELSGLLDAHGPPAVSLPGGFVARRQGALVVVLPPGLSAAPAAGPTVLQWPGRTDLGDGRRITCRAEPFDRAAFTDHCRRHERGVEMLDADQICGPLLCRPRRDGDVFQPLGCGGRQSVGDFLTNLKLPQADRARTACICDELGIVYLAPLRIDERVKVTAETRRVLRISVSPAWMPR